MSLETRPRRAATTQEQILTEISDYCRETRTAESTFGRQAVNDGKLVSRLRDGARITSGTLDKVRAYLADQRAALAGGQSSQGRAGLGRAAPTPPGFRFFDNRQKYLLFVSTCGEKVEVAKRVSLQLANVHAAPPALRLFDAGVGDGTVLARVMRALHWRFPTTPLYVVAKEISYEDVRLTLEKMADRFFEHPATVLVLTNLYYAEAPWLTPRSATSAQSLVWKDVALSGAASHGFAEQIADLDGFLAENWRAGVSPTSGNPVYLRPAIITISREDHAFLLDPILPRPGRVMADYDLVIASQPYRARASVEFKASKVIAPLARALRPGGRLVGIHSYGRDPGVEIVAGVWPGENPFTTDRHAILRQVKHELGGGARHYRFDASTDARSIFRYRMHTLPNEVAGPIGTSTLFAAWNAAIYVSQIEDQRLSEAVRDGRYLDVTAQVLNKYGGLWFNDETYVISRRPLN
jgi:SAM-dependent methyltransferase